MANFKENPNLLKIHLYFITEDAKRKAGYVELDLKTIKINEKIDKEIYLKNCPVKNSYLKFSIKIIENPLNEHGI